MIPARGPVRAWLAIWLAVLACREASRAPPGPPVSRLGAERVEPSATAPGPLDPLLARADSLYFRGEYDSARAVWTSVLVRLPGTADSLRAAGVLTWLGLVAWRTGDYPAAHELGDSALALKKRWSLTGELGASYNALGLLAWNEGRLSDALDLFDRTMQAAHGSGDRPLEVRAVGNLALVHTELGDFADARRELERERDLAHAIGETRLEGNALNNLGMWFVRTGRPDRAAPELRDARRLYASISYATGEQQALGQLGTAYAALGEPGRAIAALDSALALARAQGLKQDEASDLEALAEVYRQAGDLRRALTLYGQARTLNAALGLEVETGTDLRSEADISLTLGNGGGARTQIDSALALHRRLGARYEEFEDVLLRAQIAAVSHDAAAAEASLGRARRLRRTLGTRGTGFELALVEARIAEAEGRPRAVLARVRAVTAGLGPGDEATAWELAALEARAYAALARLDSAAVAGRRAVAAFDAIRGRFASGVLRTAFLTQRRSPYADLVDVLVRQGDVRGAFEVADAARGRALLDRLPIGRSGDSAAESSTGLLARGEEQRQLMTEIQGQIEEVERDAAAGDSNSAGTLSHLRARLAQLRTEYEELLVRAEERDPRGTALLGSRRVALREIAAALKPDEALVEYFVTPARTLAFVVSGGHVEVVPMEVPVSQLRTRVRLARDLVAARRPGAVQVLSALYDLLIAPLERRDLLRGIHRLVIVRHDALGLLPFAALRNSISWRYLIEDMSLAYVPIAGALPALRAEQRGATAAGTGTPTGLAPFTESLPATRAEAAAFRSAFPGAVIRVDAAASEGAARRALATAPVVHIASHGVMNAWNPMFSRIELYPGPGAVPEDDGHLEVHEILGLVAPANLVFLSGCETGLGAAQATAFSAGEDYATLSQAFLYAGARNVVATLWRVEDAGAAALAARFYRHYAASGPEDALRLAQRELLRQPEYSAPFYWAAYELSGGG